MKAIIPNAVTLLNLFLGSCAVVGVLHRQYTLVFWLFFGSLLADYLDGLLARWLDQPSTLGKELDSLADMVSFGLLPGAILYVLLDDSLAGAAGAAGLYWPATPAFLLTAFSALRLARFNLDTRQSETFIGLPTPSATIFCVGLMLIVQHNSFGWGSLVHRPGFYYLTVGLLSYALVAELPMFSLKFKGGAWSGNEIKYIFALTTVLLLVLLKEAALSVVIVLYLILSIILHWSKISV
jgi:CDP-diacylglycerol--serine O-phosphatidyltransferase